MTALVDTMSWSVSSSSPGSSRDYLLAVAPQERHRRRKNTGYAGAPAPAASAAPVTGLDQDLLGITGPSLRQPVPAVSSFRCAKGQRARSRWADRHFRPAAPATKLKGVERHRGADHGPFFKLIAAGPLFFVGAWLLMVFAGTVGAVGPSVNAAAPEISVVKDVMTTRVISIRKDASFKELAAPPRAAGHAFPVLDRRAGWSVSSPKPTCGRGAALDGEPGF